MLKQKIHRNNGASAHAQKLTATLGGFQAKQWTD
jgi:hypothetical protein